MEAIIRKYQSLDQFEESLDLKGYMRHIVYPSKSPGCHKDQKEVGALNLLRKQRWDDKQAFGLRVKFDSRILIGFLFGKLW